MEKPIKGGYILISLGLIALSTSYSGSIDYDRISKTKKHIVLTGIKVADTVMPDITVKPIYGNGTITFEDVYGYDIVVSSNNSVSVSEHISLDERFTKKIEAPKSTTLTNKQVAQIIKGVFVNGSIGNFENPVFFPASDEDATYYKGMCITLNNEVTYLCWYRIHKTTKVLNIVNNDGYRIKLVNGELEIYNLKNINGKVIPGYPSATGIFTYKCVNGVLTWVKDE